MTGWMKRLRSKPSLALAMVGVLLGFVSLALRDVPWWANLVACGGALVILVLVGATIGRRGENIPVSGPRHLSPDLAEKVLAVAVGSHSRPVCVQMTASHACGVGVAALAGRDVADNLNSFLAVFRSTLLEMRLEERFTKAVLLTHLGNASQLYGMLATLAQDRCFRAVGGKRGIREVVLNAADHLERCALRPVQDCLEGMPPNIGWDAEDVAWRDRIRDLITVTVPNELEPLQGEHWLPSAAQLASTLVERLREDWDRDIEQIRSDELCLAGR